MSSLSNTIILKALDGLSVRETVAAQNIANANTPGYRPLHVSFERALMTAASLGKAAVAGVEPQIGRDPVSASGMRLDLEVATASTTAMRYAALVELLNHRLQRDSLALNGNL